MSNQINRCRNLGKSILDVIERFYDGQTRQNLEIMFELRFGPILAKNGQNYHYLDETAININIDEL
jgi:hypothetical protein